MTAFNDPPVTIGLETLKSVGAAGGPEDFDGHRTLFVAKSSHEAGIACRQITSPRDDR
jgi:hypothetical protein